MTPFSFYFKNAGLRKLGDTRAYNEEFSTEMYDKVFSISSIPSMNLYENKGIRTELSSEGMLISYEGILAQNGAATVYAHVGFGDMENWENTKIYPMQPSEKKGFELLIPVKNAKRINMAFKDDANNWDNNSGQNYSFENSHGTSKH